MARYKRRSRSRRGYRGNRSMKLKRGKRIRSYGSSRGGVRL